MLSGYPVIDSGNQAFNSEFLPHSSHPRSELIIWTLGLTLASELLLIDCSDRDQTQDFCMLGRCCDTQQHPTLRNKEIVGEQERTLGKSSLQVLFG